MPLAYRKQRRGLPLGWPTESRCRNMPLTTVWVCPPCVLNCDRSSAKRIRAGKSISYAVCFFLWPAFRLTVSLDRTVRLVQAPHTAATHQYRLLRNYFTSSFRWMKTRVGLDVQMVA